MAIIKKTISGLKPDTNYIFTVKPKNTEISAVDDLSDAIRVKVPAMTNIPSSITSLTISADFQKVMFAFNPINDIDFSKYEYELYDNALGTGTPISSGFSSANVFVVSVTNSTDTTTRQYWGRVRAINTSETNGEWSSLVASGQTPLIDNQYINSLTAAKITAGTISSAEIILSSSAAVIKSSNYTLGNTTSPGTGWIIAGNGSATFNDVTIRDEIHIGEDTGTSDVTSAHIDASGNLWLGANRDSISLAPFRVYNNGSLFANNATISGTVTANNGNIGGFSITSNTLTSLSGATPSYIGVVSDSNIALFAGAQNNTGVNANFQVRSNGQVYIGGATPTVNISPNGDMILNGSLTTTSVTLSSAGYVRSASNVLVNTLTGNTITPYPSLGWNLNKYGFRGYAGGNAILEVGALSKVVDDGVWTSGNVYVDSVKSFDSTSILITSGSKPTVFGGGGDANALNYNSGIIAIADSGNVAKTRIVLDDNEIMAANGNATSILNLNAQGGDVSVGSLTSGSKILINGFTVWHSGNDGSGSGLNADQLDGISSASFVQTGTTQTISGSKTFSGSVYLDSSTYGTGIDAYTPGTNRRAVYVDFGASDRMGTVASSMKYKQDVARAVFDKEKYLKIQPSMFRWKQDVERLGEGADYDIGFIAEEARESGLDLLYFNDSEGKIEGFNYERLPIILWSIVTQQSEEISKLEQRIFDLENKNT